MTKKNKKTKIVSTFGDVDPATHGGGVIRRIPKEWGDDFYYQMEYTPGTDGDINPLNGDKLKKSDRLVYKFTIEKEIPSWVDVKGVNSFVGRKYTKEEYNNALKNYKENGIGEYEPQEYEIYIECLTEENDWYEWAIAYENIASYHGWHELDTYPNCYTQSELNRHWGMYKRTTEKTNLINNHWASGIQSENKHYHVEIINEGKIKNVLL